MKSETIDGKIFIEVFHQPGADGYTEVQRIEVSEMKFGDVFFDIENFTDVDGSTLGEKLIERHSEALADLVDKKIEERF